MGDGFPVRSLFSYNNGSAELSPFLLFDYAGPYLFEPARVPRGVGQHPHRGFETVTIVYEGEVTHRDSAGNGGTIGPGDVQWMTAGGGIVHEEFHSAQYTRTGGPFRVVQLWVNLPAKDKMAPPAYQAIPSGNIPVAGLAGGGQARIIAGELAGIRGPARTFTPVNVWDVRLSGGESTRLAVPEGHTAIIVVLSGRVAVNGHMLEQAQGARLERAGSGVTLQPESEAMLLVLTGEPLGEPVAGYGPFVMNSEAEIRQAIEDFNAGRFARMAGEHGAHAPHRQ